MFCVRLTTIDTEFWVHTLFTLWETDIFTRFKIRTHRVRQDLIFQYGFNSNYWIWYNIWIIMFFTTWSYTDCRLLYSFCSVSFSSVSALALVSPVRSGATTDSGISLCCTLMCSFSIVREVKVLLHSVHDRGVSPLYALMYSLFDPTTSCRLSHCFCSVFSSSVCALVEGFLFGTVYWWLLDG